MTNKKVTALILLFVDRYWLAAHFARVESNQVGVTHRLPNHQLVRTRKNRLLQLVRLVSSVSRIPDEEWKHTLTLVG